MTASPWDPYPPSAEQAIAADRDRAGVRGASAPFHYAHAARWAAQPAAAELRRSATVFFDVQCSFQVLQHYVKRSPCNSA